MQKSKIGGGRTGLAYKDREKSAKRRMIELGTGYGGVIIQRGKKLPDKKQKNLSLPERLRS